MIKLAIIKINGLSPGGTEKFLQTIAMNLPKDRFKVDYYYSDPVVCKNPDSDPVVHDDSEKIALMRQAGVNLIKFNLDYVDLGVYTHDWINTDFWDKFSENKYDIIQTGRAGNPEYPFYKIKKTAIIDSLHLSGMVDNQYNISRVMYICKWNANKWIKKGGDKKRVVLVSHPMDIKFKGGDLRDEYNIKDKFVFGFHQRNEDSIFSEIPLLAYKMVESESNVFIILGGSKKYREQAKSLGIKNIIFLDHSADQQFVYKFLNTLNVYAHGRKDGEVNSTAMAEALYFGCPIISHFSEINNGHVECIGNAGAVFSNINDYAKELNRMEKDREYYNSLSEKAKKRFFEKYELGGQMDNIISIYEDVIKRPFPNKIRRAVYHFFNFLLKRLLINKYNYKTLRKVRDYFKKIY